MEILDGNQGKLWWSSFVIVIVRWWLLIFNSLI